MFMLNPLGAPQSALTIAKIHCHCRGSISKRLHQN
uniref:Uncharacterized protein n=1 Tax=Lepeophtheirus salmonis TaxID=72036 RepID=A0A0K2TBV2_LEPSM